MKITIAATLGLFIATGPVFGARELGQVQLSQPASALKPAQRDLTEVFLQIGSSLKQEGSPVPYLLHMKAEHDRIEAKYQQRFGMVVKSYRPAYMTDEYLARLSANWNALSPKLGLDSYAKNVGTLIGDAIHGTSGTAKTLLEVFNQHQARVFDAMVGKPDGAALANFEHLKAQLITGLELDKDDVNEWKSETARRDAMGSAAIVQGATMKLFKRLDAGLKPADAERVKAALTSVFIDVGRMAHSELEAGIAEWALASQETTSAPVKSGSSEQAATVYDPTAEELLSADERKAFLALLKKKAFTREDFPLLENFYSTAFDKLSERGKDEISKRTWAGTRQK